MTRRFIFSWFLNCSLVHVSLSFQQLEAFTAESKQEIKAFNIISTHWVEKVFWRTVWLFLASNVEGGNYVKPLIFPPQPDTCRVFLASATGRAMPAPHGLCWLSSQKLLWEAKVCGQMLDEAEERISRPALGDSLKKTSSWARACLKVSFRTATGHGPSWNLTSEMGSLQIRVWGCPQLRLTKGASTPPPSSFARRQKKISIPKKALLGPAAF